MIRFAAMGCEVVAEGADEASLRSLFAAYERAFSRFVPDSELVRVNAAAADEVVVTPLFARAVGEALRAADATDGLVDPTLAAALDAAGYDRDFAALRDEGPAGEPVPGRLAEVSLDGLVLRRPAGLALDLNGVVKALAVDDAVRALRIRGFVSAGGDLAVRGPVEVALPGGGSVRVLDGGMATSGSLARRWRRGGAWQHHLIDPRTGRPAESPWQQVTVSGGTCVDADVAAKAAFLLGRDGPDWLDDHGLPGRFVGRRGVLVETAAWARALEPEAACT